MPTIKAIEFVTRLNPVYEVGHNNVKRIVKLEEKMFKVIKDNSDFVIVYNPDCVHYIWEENKGNEHRGHYDYKFLSLDNEEKK